MRESYSMFKKIILASILACMHIWLASAFEASYYSDAFEGGTSANGTTFSQANHTAAICYEELSQLAYVSTAQTGMVVTLTDRPNCSRHTDRIDLSSSVFSTFVPLSSWLITDISATPLGIKTGKFVKRNLSQQEFSTLWVELKNGISNSYFAGDSILIEWRVTDGNKQAILFLVWKETGKQIVDAAWTDDRWNFSFVLNLPDIPEMYDLVIASGNSATTERAVDIRTFSKEGIIYPDIPLARYLLNPTISSSRDYFGIRLPQTMWWQLRLIQWDKKYITQWTFLSFSWFTFTPGRAQVVIDGYMLSTPSSLDRSSRISSMFSGAVILDRTHESIWRDKLTLRATKSTATFRLKLKSDDKVRATYYVTLPNGDVRTYDLPKTYVTGSWLLKTGVWITGNFPIRDSGSYKFELVQEDGFAYVNIPLYQWKIWPIIEKLTDIEKKSVTKNPTTVRKETYDAINTLRVSLWRTSLTRDDKLDLLAQKKADYMAKNDDLSHVTRDGRDIGDFAQSLWIQIVGSIAENIAWGKWVSWKVLQDGLEESGSHRHSMVNPVYTRVWIGYVVSWDKTYMVQVFGN